MSERESSPSPEALPGEVEHLVAERTAKLEHIIKELEAFSYLVSHELRTPLRDIGLCSKTILTESGDRLDAQGKEHLQAVQHSVQRMNQMIENLLAFSRADMSAAKSVLVDMQAVAEQVKRELSVLEYGPTLPIHIDPLPRCVGDEALFKHVFGNLLSNALKFTKTRAEPKIEVGAKVAEQENIYYVKDNGVGFNPLYVSRLFKAFERLHTEKEFEGSGIGLSFVRRIVERQGGRVWAESCEGQGATFYFSIPHAPHGYEHLDASPLNRSLPTT